MTKNKESKHRSAAYDIWRAFRSNKVAVICMIIVAFFLFVSIFADVLFDYNEVVIAQHLDNMLQPPSAAHWFGTDALGRDYFARIMYATRITMIICLTSTAASTLLSIIIGGLAAYYGGLFDTIIMRFLDIILAVPQMLLIICIVMSLGNSIINIILTLVVILLPQLVRQVRADVFIRMQNEYVEAARSIGAGGIRILLSHVIPNCISTVVVRATMLISTMILCMSGLGWLGLGVPAPAPEWGRMLAEAQTYMRMKPYLIIFPGLVILTSATAFNLLGDSLRDAMDPRLRGFRRTKKKLFAGRKAK